MLSLAPSIDLGFISTTIAGTSLLITLISLYLGWRQRSKVSDLETEGPDTSVPDPLVDLSDGERERVLRLDEAREALARQESQARRLRIAARGLAATEYSVSAALASVFFSPSQGVSSTPSAWIAVAALSVVATQTLRLLFRPDVRAAGAAHRAFTLRYAIRRSENEIRLAQLGCGAMTVKNLMTLITDAITLAEQSESDELAARMNALAELKVPTQKALAAGAHD